MCTVTENKTVENTSIIRIRLPFKDQVAANAVSKQLHNLRIDPILQPVFVSTDYGKILNPEKSSRQLWIVRHVIMHRFACFSFIRKSIDFMMLICSIFKINSINEAWGWRAWHLKFSLSAKMHFCMGPINLVQYNALVRDLLVMTERKRLISYRFHCFLTTGKRIK